ncbi:MAG: IPT/TIG domain-containing protein [Burkholderiales bacterium]|nr:IPT/TIG domain-containing protein [Burkholderiales bacterium]
MPVVINGANMAGSAVMIGGAFANVTNNTGQQINTTVPNSALVGNGFLTVSNGILPIASIPFTVTAAPVGAPPTISGVLPASGSAGTPVTISGNGLNGATVTIGGAAATITLGSGNSISTTVPGNATVGAGNIVVTTSKGSSPPFAFTVNPPPVGGAEVSVEGVTLPNPSKFAYIAPGVRSGQANGAGQEVNAYAMPGAANCNTSPALTRSWMHIIDLQNYRGQVANEYFVMQGGESLTYKFTAPMVDASGGFSYNDAANAAIRPTFMTITPDRCNFDKTKLNTPIFNGCFKAAPSGNSVTWANLDPSVFMPAGMCRLEKGKTYYFNLRFQEPFGAPNEDSCVGGNCGGVLQFQ